MLWWEEQVVTQVVTLNGGVLHESDILKLSAKLAGSALTAAQIRSAFGDEPAIDGPTFLQWWRDDSNQGGTTSRYAPRSVLQIVNGIKRFQGIGCHSLRRTASQDSESPGELLGGETLVQEVARRVLQVASETLLESAKETVVAASAVATSAVTTDVPDALVGLTQVPDHALEAELRRRGKASM